MPQMPNLFWLIPRRFPLIHRLLLRSSVRRAIYAKPLKCPLFQATSPEAVWQTSPISRDFHPVTWFILKIASKIDPILMRVTGGRVNTTSTNAFVVLHRIGAKTGRARQTPLLYFTEGRNVVLVAGNPARHLRPARLVRDHASFRLQIRMTVPCIRLLAHGAHSGVRIARH